MGKSPNLKSIFLVVLFLFSGTSIVFGQSQSGCTISFPNNFDNQVDFSAIYNPALCPSGDVIMDNLNDKFGNSTLTFDATITLNSLTLNYKNGSNPLEIIIPVGVTLTITNDLIMNVNSTPQDKFLTVNGTLSVGGTLDFGDINLEIDGTGLIEATTIIGADNTTCEGSGTCPVFTVDTCTGASGLCTETVLPIELLFFRGNSTKESVSLSWATASEENFNYFEIERAAQGTSFEIIGEIEGDGNSFTRLDYSFEDNIPEIGLNYYRLKSIDFDGTFEYSEVILVKFASNVKLVVFPNPTLGAISVRTSIPTTNGLNYKITNQYGVEVLSGYLSAFKTQVDLQGLTKGVYILKLVELPGVKAQRIILK